MKTAALVPYANNARLHTDEQVGQICESIRRYGFNDPVGVWTNADGEPEIVEGHGRVMAAKRLGIEEVPVVRLDHLTDEQRREYALVHNQTTDSSEWDVGMLEVELAEIAADMEPFGFDLGVSIDGFGDSFELPDGDGPEFKTISLHLTSEQHDLITAACDSIDREDVETRGGNEYGDKLCEIARQWAGR